MDLKKVGIVMPCINLWSKFTLPALASVATAQRIASEKGIESQVLLIDNASTDETKTEGATRAGIEYVRNEEMWGFQKSVNFGVNHFLSKGYDLVLVLNNDIVMHEQSIARLIERFEDQVGENLGMVTCMDVRGECYGNPMIIETINIKEKENVEESGHPNFSAFMLNRKCWEEVGEFDEVFAPAYYEDNDYHHRMILGGMLAITYPPAMFFHWGSRTQNEAIGRPLTDSSNQHAFYVRKWGGSPGQETFKTPYNEPSHTIRFTLQAESKNGI